MTAAQARRRFADARVARLATADAEGHPHLVPIVFALAGETVYSVVDDKPKHTTELKRLDNVRANRSASILVDHYDDGDWGALWWVRVDGSARVLTALEPEARGAIELLADRYPRQRALGSVLAVDVTRWSHWSARGCG